MVFVGRRLLPALRPPGRAVGLDARADNYVLSACRASIPREIGASTFHDAAVARAVFGFAWPRNETLAYHAQPPRDPIFGPAHCDS